MAERAHPLHLRWVVRWWRRRSLRARITLLATSLFAVALVLAGAILLVTVGKSLLRTLDSSAERSGQAVAALVQTGRLPSQLLAGSGGVSLVQVVDGNNRVISASPGADTAVSVLSSDELARARKRGNLTVDGERASLDTPLRVVAVTADLRSGQRTVLVGTDLGRVIDSSRSLEQALLFGCPLIIAAMAILTWWITGLTLRPVDALQRGAAELSASGLARSRLPVPVAQDEIYSLALTLNSMLDRLDAATSRQRRFVGDAAHELRSPIASLRVQLEVAQRVDQTGAIAELTSDALQDVDRLANLIDDLLALARSDERGPARVRLPVALDELARTIVAGYREARVPVRCANYPTANYPTADYPAADEPTAEGVTEAGAPETGALALSTAVPGLIAPAAVQARATDPNLTVLGDRDGLHRVLINLLDNAVRYAASTVTVGLASVPAADGRPASVLLSVTDDGPGVPASKRERVFDRFYRLDTARSRAEGGTGLGLAIVREIVNAHGGSVQLRDNEPGLLVEISLPVG